MHNEVQIDKTLKAYLKRSNMTQVEFSKVLGLPSSTVHNYLYGAIPKGLTSVIALANALQLSLDNLVFGTDETLNSLEQLD